MKDLKDIILEKLIINKNTKIYSEDIFIDTILSFIYSEPEDASQEEIKAITDWVKDEHIKNLKIITTEKIFKQYYIINTTGQINNLKRKFETSNFKIDLVEDSIYNNVETDNGENNYIVYKSKYNNEGSCTIYRNDKIHLLIYHFKGIGCFFFVNNSNK